MSVLSEVRTHKLRMVKTIILYLILMAVGMNISTLGVTLLDLKIAVKETLDKIAFVMPMNAAGLVCGSVTCGILMEYVDYQIILMISLLLSSFATAFIPWNRNLWHLCANFSISGFLIGFISLGGNTWILHLWGKESPSFMQAYHFAFGLGSFIAPLIAAPFLLPLNEENTNVTKTYTPSDLKIQYAYGISAFTMLICEVLFILIFCLQRTNKPHPTLEKKTVELDQKPITTIKRLSCVILTCIFMFFFYGLELSFGSLLPAYLVNCGMKISKAKASYMTSLFWLTFTFCRCFTIFAVNLLSSQSLLTIDLLMISVANVILMLLGRTNELTLMLGIALMGFGTSPLFATIFGFLQEFMDISSKVSSSFFVSCYIGTFIIPLIIGKSVESTPEVFLYLSITCNIMLCVSFIGLVLVKKCHLKSCEAKRKRKARETELTCKF